MGYLHVSLAPSKELYEKIRGQVDLDAMRADGLLLHAASELPGGEVRIVDVWADAEAMGRGDDRIRATFAAAAIVPMIEARPQPEVSETFELVH